MFLKATGFPWWYLRAAKIGVECVCGEGSFPFLPQEFCFLCFTFGFLHKIDNKKMDSVGKKFLNP